MRDTLKDILAGVDREAWIRFVIAVIGLVLAFGMALLSTAFSEGGNMIASMAFASLALVLATAVGGTTVPYLARRVGVGRIRDAFNYEVTKEGVFYIILTVVIAIAALNTGNNLLFLVVAAMLAAVIVSGIASAIVLLSLQVELELPQRLFANQSYLAYIILRNQRRFVPALSIHVKPPEIKQPREKWEWH